MQTRFALAVCVKSYPLSLRSLRVLLTQPPSLVAAMTFTISDTDRGRVETAAIYGGGKLVRKLGAPREHLGVMLTPAVVPELTKPYLKTAIALCTRIAPWMHVVATPALWCEGAIGEGYPTLTKATSGDGRSWRPALGLCHHEARTIFLSLGCNPETLLETALHEAFHAIDKILPEVIREIIDRDIGEGLCPGEGGYWSSQSERRARAFEGWGSRLINGLPGRFVKTEHPEGIGIDEVFSEIWTGEVARLFLTGAFTSKDFTERKSLIQRIFEWIRGRV